MNITDDEFPYLNLLAQQYPSIQAASTAIINLNAELHLPRGREHFISDLHGEYEAFRHVLKNGSGSIRRKIADTFPDLPENERRRLATLIYYPEQKLPLILETVDDPAEWYRGTLLQLIELCRELAANYTRSWVREHLPEHFAGIVEELLYQQRTLKKRIAYCDALLSGIVATGSGRAFIVALSELIQRLTIARLHIIGDIYDRGPGAHLIMDALMAYHSVDIQWGNHDILWMGAAAGSEACIANVIRICLRYANMETLEHGYAVSLLPLASLAIETYGDDPCERFLPRSAGDEEFTDHEIRLMAQMHKAVTIMQFKLEGQIIRRRPHYQMNDRLLLDKVDHARGTIRLDGNDYRLLDTRFPTVDPKDPYRLTEREQGVIDKLKLSFAGSKRLQQHVRFLFSRGGMYRIHNGNLLYHGCISMNEDGSFSSFVVDDQRFAAKAFMDRVERLARQGYFAIDDPVRKQYGMDAMWYLWTGDQSPLFGKAKMATFERYFVHEKEPHAEKRNAYYTLRDSEATARQILAEFGLDPDSGRIINGHVPVKVRKGESPVKAGGRLVVIDGGLAKAYQAQTGIAGYTLVCSASGLRLAAHHPFESTRTAIRDELDIDFETEMLEPRTDSRVIDTDRGRKIEQQLADLHRLLAAYRAGLVKEQ